MILLLSIPCFVCISFGFLTTNLALFTGWSEKKFREIELFLYFTSFFKKYVRRRNDEKKLTIFAKQGRMEEKKFIQFKKIIPTTLLRLKINKIIWRAFFSL